MQFPYGGMINNNLITVRTKMNLTYLKEHLIEELEGSK